MNLLAVLVLGFFLGMRHATDADHVVAVTAIVSRERSTRAALLIGALWGLGHTFTILVVGGAIVLFGLVIPTRLGLSMELSVALMLVLLGALNMTGAMRRSQEASHAHAEESDSSSAQAEGHAHSLRACRKTGLAWTRSPSWMARPLIVGLVHGLAGSAAIALLVLTTMREAKRALLYLAVFVAGTVLGMMLLTGTMAAPLAAASRRFPTFDRLLARATGLVSIAFGLFLAYRIGFVDGLFLAHPAWTPD